VPIRKFIVNSGQFARAKDRARVEDELETVRCDHHILDRSWIVDQAVSNDRKDLAFNYLGVGRRLQAWRMGPTDYSAHSNFSIEKTLGNPEAFSGMKMQRVTGISGGSLLSRNLELPRIETDDGLPTAIRLAEQDGTYRQKLGVL
jgi:hypothetical protein